jgi:arylsulfatase A-like enzyme
MKLMDVPEWEAEHLVAAGYAEYYNGEDEENENSEVVSEEPEAVEDDDFDSDFGSDFDEEEDPERIVKPKAVPRPKTTDSKAKWVAYAVYQGAGEDEAWGLTKPNLIKQYGDS